jgi:PIN domain nuclease of toxin-antitoxin system
LKLLLDTQALLWGLADDPHLGKRARAAFNAPASELYVSAASFWEMGIKAALGKLALPVPLDRMAQDLAEAGFHELPVHWRHAQAVQALPWHHRDPFDRMIIAQALSEDLTLLSSDRTFKSYKVRLLW